MQTNTNNQKRKKGLLAAIWESMTKTGGCCGSGGNCCGPADANDGGQEAKKQEADRSAGGRHES